MPWYKDAAGKPMWVDDSAPRAVPIGPQNPTFPYQGPKAAEDLRGSTLNNQGQAITNNRTAALTPFDVRKSDLETQKLELELEAMRQEQANKDPLGNGGSGDVMRDAMAKLQDIDTIRQKKRSGVATVGSVFTPLVSNIPGTDAYDVRNASERIGKAGALAKILDMTKTTGKNPFTPMSNSDVQLIADTTGSVDTGLSGGEYDRQLNQYQNAYVRGYAGAAGNQALRGAVEQQYDKYVRENPNSTAAQRKAFRSVLEMTSRKNYEQRMSSMDFTQPREKPAASGAKFLGFEN